MIGFAMVAALCVRSAAGDPAPAAAVLAAVPAAEVKKLEAGRVVLVQGGDTTSVTGLVIFERPARRVMLLLSQAGRQREYRPELMGGETVATYPDGFVEEQRVRIVFTNVEYFLRYHVDSKELRITWNLDPSHHNGLRKVSGSWELYALGAARTLGRFATQVDVGALPAFLQDYATRERVPKVIENARRWVDSDGRWRP